MIDRNVIALEIIDGRLYVNGDQRGHVEANSSGRTFSAYYTRSGYNAGSRYPTDKAAIGYVATLFVKAWLNGQDTDRV